LIRWFRNTCARESEQGVAHLGNAALNDGCVGFVDKHNNFDVSVQLSHPRRLLRNALHPLPPFDAADPLMHDSLVEEQLQLSVDDLAQNFFNILCAFKGICNGWG
jgi:hypothetical protein